MTPSGDCPRRKRIARGWAAKRLGMSRSELFARAAETWLQSLEQDETTAAIDRAIAAQPSDHDFTAAAAAALAAGDQR